MKNNIIISAVATLILFSGCATTRDFIYLQDRIADLEKYRLETEEKQNQLNSSIGKINKSQDSVDQDTKTRYASLKAELTSLKQEIRTLNGRIDELNYMIENINNSDKTAQAGIERIEETGTENTNRIMRLEEYLGFENAAPKFKANGEIQVVKKETTSDDLYNRAKNSFDKNMFEPARIGFQKFINEYPDSENADNALFWIGETYYRQKQYKKAILEYQKALKNNSHNIDVLNCMAWFLATCQGKKHRHGELAFNLINKIIETDHRNLNHLDILAAVYAEI